MSGGYSSKKLARAVKVGALYISYVALFFLLTLCFWVPKKFGNPTMEQIIFHLQYFDRAIEYTDPGLVRSFIDNCLLVSCAYGAFLLFLEPRLLNFLKSSSKPSYQFAHKFFRGKTVFYLFFIVSGLFVVKFDAFSLLDNSKTEDFIKDHYALPQVSLQKGTSPKNLILIYVESLEASYLNRKLFPGDLLGPLESLPGFQFENFRQAPGTGWTMAGITSTQCAIPLKPVGVTDENSQGEIFKKFLPNAICLGDILNKFGYESVFLGGAALGFSGKGKFFASHGYTKAMGRDEWLATGRYEKSEMNSWGLYDEALFREAKAELDRLASKKGGRFNLTLLTLETHFPSGIMSPECAKRGGKSFEDIIRCSAENVADFILYAKERGYLENTNVMILGDHLTMPNPVSEKLETLQERRIYNKWIASGASLVPLKNRSEIVHFDVAPTLLEFLGFQVTGDRFGLGYSALNKAEKSPAQGRIDELHRKVLRSSEFYSKLCISKTESNSTKN